MSDKNPRKEMKINNKIVTDPMTIANQINKFFTNIGPNLANKISNVHGDISTVFNISLENGLFPDKLKIAKIIPIYKSEDRLLTNNYCPISVLLFFQNV